MLKRLQNRLRIFLIVVFMAIVTLILCFSFHSIRQAQQTADITYIQRIASLIIYQLEADSSVKTGMTLNIAINYGGRPEIVRAAQRLAARAAAGEIRPEEITEQMLSDAMYTEGQKDPDFILRPSGEKRLSNFMLWQAAYSELVEMLSLIHISEPTRP